jgi:hypothetical protein
VARNDPVALFNQALMSGSGAICIRFGDAKAAAQFRLRLYKARLKLRANKAREQRQRMICGQVPTYDIKGNPIGMTDVWGPNFGRVETPYDCLQLRVVNGDLVIRRVLERVSGELDALPAHPEAYDLPPDEVGRLPRWPLRSFRSRAA